MATIPLGQDFTDTPRTASILMWNLKTKGRKNIFLQLFTFINNILEVPNV